MLLISWGVHEDPPDDVEAPEEEKTPMPERRAAWMQHPRSRAWPTCKKFELNTRSHKFHKAKHVADGFWVSILKQVAFWRCSDPSEKRYAVLVVKVPYTMHIVTQLPQHKHLHEESNAKHYIEEKLVTDRKSVV